MKDMNMDMISQLRESYAEHRNVPLEDSYAEFDEVMASIYRAGRESVANDLLLVRQGKEIGVNPFE